jgi:ribosome biogenesis GTPase A
MQLGILGLPKVGKTTLFNTLTASRQETDKFAVSDKTNIGVANVRDERLERLRDLFKPRRYVPATIQYVDIPGIKKGESAESLDLAKRWSTSCAPSESPRSSTRRGRSTRRATSRRSTSS